MTSIPHQDRRQQADSSDSPLRDGDHYPSFPFPKPRPPGDDEADELANSPLQEECA